MTEGVNEQANAQPEKAQSHEGLSNKEFNFRKLEAAREADREARIRAEMQAEQMRNELREIKEMLQPKEQDPLDGVEDFVDPVRLKAKLEKERTRFTREAKEIAERTYEERKQKDEKANFFQRLRGQFSDYDEVMNETNLAHLQEEDPVFLDTVVKVPDEYERRLDTYKKIKSMQAKKPKLEERASIKEKVEENMRNPYFIQPSSGNPSAVEFDIRSKSARDQAYQKLKAAQKMPIGNGHGQSRQ
jgi:hypothetical protein